MPLKCVAIDDELPALQLMQKYIADHPQLQLLQTFTDAVSASEYLKHTRIDLLFVDINMPDITGLDLVRSLTHPPMIVFTTAYKKFAIDGFELDAVDYLLKPISFERFSKAVQKAADYYNYKSKPAVAAEEVLMVFSEYQLIKINCSNIEYIESLDDYIRIHSSNTKPVMTLMTLKAVLDKLPLTFKRIHRSYIVNSSKIKSAVNRKLKLTSDVELPVSETYIDVIKEWKQA
ncbi:LytTR family two component transcriptional regulator [Lacibacter cauensis]|uniref:LytTR family two component transcriptional regulator n=1 Tax=Lacibacter cauensis TaxID=510947 RepID=A0A562SQ54_9BACT|nr:LytTR family DNA-binding domain-containing protein [Lacibacter cauensis]TWI83397.1 LytTR family two component transcriptional regulator [Lacibacter cauensis]